MTNPVVLCYGEIDLDIYLAVNRFPEVASHATVRHEFANVGGGAANTACWLANWDLPVRLSGNALGVDANGELIRNQLQAYPSLDTRYLAYRDSYQTPVCQCLVRPDGERTFILHMPDEISMMPLSPAMFDGVCWLSLDMSGQLEARLHAAKTAHNKSIPILVNDIYEDDHPIVGLVDIIVMSAEVMRRKYPQKPIQSVAQSIRTKGHCDVIVTDGANPIAAFLRNGDNLSVCPPTIEAIDTTGAGDVFKAGLLYGLIHQQSFEQALKYAVAAGAAKAMRAGTTKTPAPLDHMLDLASETSIE